MLVSLVTELELDGIFFNAHVALTTGQK